MLTIAYDICMGTITKDPDLYDRKLLKLFVPNALSASGVLFVNLFSSVIAGQIIGPKALAAIALVSPILLIDEVLHDLLGSGVSRIVPQLKVKEGSRSANRFLAVILAAVLAVYGLETAILLALKGPILGLFTKDAELTELASAYLVPALIAGPFLEIFLCLQRAYSVDGHAKLFSLRAPISTAGSLLFSFLFVAVFKWGMTGVALASVLSSVLGYVVLLIHRFSGAASIHPDFSVLKEPKEALAHLKTELDIGKEFAPWDLIGVLIGGLVNKLFLAAGGDSVLAIRTVTENVMGILYTLSFQFNSSFNVVTCVLLGGEDHETLKKLVRKAARFLCVLGSAASLILFVFATPVCSLFGAEDALLSACTGALRLALLTGPFFLYYRLNTDLFLSLGKTKYVRLLEGCCTFLSLPFIWLLSPLGTNGAIAGYYGAYVACGLIAFFLNRTKDLFPAETEEDRSLTSLFFELSPETNAEAARMAWEFLSGAGFGRASSYLASLLIEECCQCVLSENKNTDAVSMYIRIKVSGGKLRLIFCDDGAAFNLLEALTENHIDPDSPEARIIVSAAQNMTYERILEMNYLNLTPERKLVP